MLPDLSLTHDEEQEDEKALQGVEQAEEDLEGETGRVDDGERAEGPGQTEKNRDGQHALQALDGHTPLALVSGPDFVGTAGQLADHKHRDDDVEEENQANDEKLAEVEGKSKVEEATLGRKC